MKILICGGDGQLGSDCVRILQHKHEVVAVDIGELDITNLADVEGMIRGTTPSIIVNCAAYTQVDACDSEGTGLEGECAGSKESGPKRRKIRQPIDTYSHRLHL